MDEHSPAFRHLERNDLGAADFVPVAVP